MRADQFADFLEDIGCPIEGEADGLPALQEFAPITANDLKEIGEDDPLMPGEHVAHDVDLFDVEFGKMSPQLFERADVEYEKRPRRM